MTSSRSVSIGEPVGFVFESPRHLDEKVPGARPRPATLLSAAGHPVRVLENPESLEVSIAGSA